MHLAAAAEIFPPQLSWTWTDTQGLLLFLCVLLLVKYVGSLPSRTLPPGPLPLPVIGNMLSISVKDPFDSLCQLIDRYGSVSRIDVGPVRCVVLSGIKNFKEAFLEKAETFAERPSYPLNQRLCKGLEKVQTEIDQMIGQNRQPSMDDRARMHFTNAVIHEVQRFGNIVPIAPPRMSNRDTTISGYKVPKVSAIRVI
uniref:Uncharacterized protein n=1 Tax=Scleropages formosus TaxID=113540 RepID=A0A8C9W441_SCLFO